MPRLVALSDDRVDKLELRPYLREEQLQLLLERNPELIAIDEIDPSASDLVPIGWEIPLCGQALDLLYIDLEGRLTAVEAKLRKNPEIRRAVLGQILEYASSLSEWTVDDIRDQADGYFRDPRLPKRFHGLNLQGALSRASGSETPDAFDMDAFWESAAACLRNSDMNLVIAVDRIVDPLRKAVTFTARDSSYALYLLEVQEYRHVDGTALAAMNLYGMPRKRAPHGWDEQRFAAALAKAGDTDGTRVVANLLEFINSEADGIEWGKGATYGSAGFAARASSGRVVVFWVYTKEGGQIAFSGSAVKKLPGEGARRQFLDALRSVGIPNVEKLEVETNWLIESAAILSNDSKREAFKNAVRRFVDDLH